MYLPIYTIRGSIPFGLQKDSFWLAKGLLLERKRAPFTMQKDSFCTVKGLHFKINRLKII